MRAEQSPLDLSQPPFTVGHGTEVEIGRQIADLYRRLDESPLPVCAVWQASWQAAGLDRQSPLFHAGLAIAGALDAGEGTGIPGGYHATRHYVEVLLSATHLMLRNNGTADDSIVLTQEEKGKLLVAALAHDFHYEPGGNVDSGGNPVPYRLETISLNAARPYLERAGVAAPDIHDIGTMILTTDVSPASGAGGFLRAAHRHLFEGGEKPSVVGSLRNVEPVLTDRRLARMAALLSDADILSSAGLSVECGHRSSRKLSCELNKRMEPRHTIGFLKTVAQDRFATPAARFFMPNMEAIRADALRQMDDVSCTSAQGANISVQPPGARL